MFKNLIDNSASVSEAQTIHAAIAAKTEQVDYEPRTDDGTYIFSTLAQLVEARRTTWKKDAPEAIQAMAYHALELTERYEILLPWTSAARWAQISLELESLAVARETKKIHLQVAAGQHSENLAAESIQMLAQLSADDRIDLLVDLLQSDQELNENKTDPLLQEVWQGPLHLHCRRSRALAGRALLLFDEAVTLWEVERGHQFLETLSSAVYLADLARSWSTQYDSDLAEFIAEATNAVGDGAPQPDDVMKLAAVEMARKGGQARGATYQGLKDIAIQLASEGNFKSRRNAAITIAPKLIELSKRNSHLPRLSQDQAVTTVKDWLKEAGLPVNRSS